MLGGRAALDHEEAWKEGEGTMKDVRSGVRRLGVAIAVLSFAGYLMLTALPAHAAVTCLYDAVNRQVNITSNAAETTTIRVGGGGAIEIDVNGGGFNPC